METMATALNIAVMVGKENIHFVEKLVELMPVEALTSTNISSETPLHVAATVGNTEAAAILAGKHPPLLYIGAAGKASTNDMLPIHYAAIFARRDALMYLLDVTRDDRVAVNETSCADFIDCLINANFFVLQFFYSSHLSKHVPEFRKEDMQLAGTEAFMRRYDSLQRDICRAMQTFG
ncbi:hypothetical protein RHSIM_Rhsim05G0009600 [Rhododendron simsii]|uniref:Uncharacterized protein n=1 Tax=Rhododendron simsii TaxID=118357 RepID=A0A834LM76_RHOSS|nr:hypothetical protein RHSIM_Rhsim05G0009600 [Rhododendron simsii]